MTDLALTGRLISSLFNPRSFAFVRKLKSKEKRWGAGGWIKERVAVIGLNPADRLCHGIKKMARLYKLLVCNIPESGVWWASPSPSLFLGLLCHLEATLKVSWQLVLWCSCDAWTNWWRQTNIWQIIAWLSMDWLINNSTIAEPFSDTVVTWLLHGCYNPMEVSYPGQPLPG